MNIQRTFTSSQKDRAAGAEPKVIIAQKNQISSARMARTLAKKSYTVETTGSAASLMESLLHHKLWVVVLGDGLEEGLSVASLIPLLKSCSPHSTIILVMDDVSSTEEVKVRQQGIFYSTNRPVCALEWDELRLAIDCAFNKVKLSATLARPFCDEPRV